MAASTGTLLHTVEGPKGIVEVFEVEGGSPEKGTTTVYEVVFGTKRERVYALGHACILAQEAAGLEQ